MRILRLCTVASLVFGATALVNLNPLAAQADVCTITGTAGDDILTGTEGDDIICGKSGNDTINGLGGNDTIYGGNGKDVIDGGLGDDIIEGDNDNDEINGSDGADIIYGESGNDTMTGGGGNDTLNGKNGKDLLYGNEGNDVLVGGTSKDVINGGDGINRCTVEKIDAVAKGTCDTNGPRLTKISLITKSVDTSQGPAEVKVRFSVVDDLSGIKLSLFSLKGPKGVKAQILGCIGDDPTGAEANGQLHEWGKCEAVGEVVRNPITGFVTRGDFISTMTMPMSSQKGLWYLDSISMWDGAGNDGLMGYNEYTKTYTYDSNSTQTIQTNVRLFGVKQTGEGDSESPKLISLSTTTPVVDATEDTFAEFTVRATDNFGLEKIGDYSQFENSISVEGPGIAETTSCIGENQGSFLIGDKALDALATCSRVSGTAKDGTYKVRVPVAKNSPRGTYKVTAVYLRDSARNQTALTSWTEPERNDDNPKLKSEFMASFTVKGGTNDTAKPVIAAAEVLTPTISTASAAATVRVRFKMSDASGIAFRNSQFEFISPANSGAGKTITNASLVSGSAQDGVWEISFNMPQFSPIGTWKLSRIYVNDRVGNEQHLDARTIGNDMSFAPLYGATFTNS